MPDLAARRYAATPVTMVDGGSSVEGVNPARTRAADPVGSVHTGSVLDGRYRLDELIGLGGTASVYRGRDTLLDRTVAVKVFHGHLTDDAMVARQRQEMQIVARLRHRNLVLLHDARNSADEPSYLVLEFVPGSTLARRIEQGPLEPAEVAGIGVGIAGALQAVHVGGLVHRDVKPGNILLGADGEAKLSDFGIARVVAAERITDSADVVGTAPYLSPEQARGKPVGPAADIYPLGLVLLEALTGHREFPGAPVEAAVARLLRDPVIPDDLPAGWASLLRRMTAFMPGDRPSADQVAAELSTLRAGGTPEVRATAGRSVVGGRRRTAPHARLAGGLVAASVAVAAVFGVLAARDDSGPGSAPGARADSTSSVAGTPNQQRPAAARTGSAAADSATPSAGNALPSAAKATPPAVKAAPSRSATARPAAERQAPSTSSVARAVAAPPAPTAQPTTPAPGAVTARPATPTTDRGAGNSGNSGNSGKGAGGASASGKGSGAGKGQDKAADKPGKPTKAKPGKGG